MKKQKNSFAAFISKIANSKKKNSASRNYKNYTSLVNNFKAKTEVLQ